MRRFHIRHGGVSTLVLALVAGSALSFSGTAQAAADEAATVNAPDDIVVTARRVAESARDVPVALTAFSADTIRNRSITDPQSLQGQVPSLTVGSYGQGRESSTYTLRGQGQVYGGAPSVVTYVNDVPMISTSIRSVQGPTGMFLDLENVQVINGPQGTLFGRNTTGGAVLLTPAAPRDELTGYVLGEFGNYRDRAIEAVINAPVSDKLAIRVAGRRQTRDGFTNDLVSGVKYDNKDQEYVRFSAKWNPTDSLENLTVAYYSDSKSNGTGAVLIAASAAAYGGGLAAVGATYPAPYNGIITNYLNTIGSRGPRNVAINSQPMANNRVTGWGVTDRLSYELSDALTLRNIASISHLAVRGYTDDGMILPVNQGPNTLITSWPDSYRQYTEEFQLQGRALDRKLQYQAGIYYEKVETDAPNLYLTYSNATRTKIVQTLADKRSLGLYAQGTLNFGALSAALESLNLTAGIRYTRDHNRVSGLSWYAADPSAPIQSCANGVNPAPTSPADCAVGNDYRHNEVTWTAGLDYHLTRNVMAYAKVSRGYKAGGVNNQAVNLANTTFQPETVTAYEAGLKSDFGDGDLRGHLNVNGYLNKFNNIQKASADFNPTTLAFGAATYNAARATIKGIELEAGVKFANFDIQANYSYTDAKYGDFKLVAFVAQADCSNTGAATGVRNLTCIPVEGVAKNQGSITGNWNQPLGKLGTLRVTANYAYMGPRNVAPTALEASEPGSRLEGYGLLNLSVGLNGIMGSQLDLRAFATNLTNATYRQSNTNIYGFYRFASSVYGEPRMYGLQAKLNF